MPLPSTAFDPVRWESRTADKYGLVDIDSNRYLAGLEIAADMIPVDAPEAVRRQASEVIDGAKAETRASWWIDNRDSGNVRGAIDYYRDAQC